MDSSIIEDKTSFWDKITSNLSISLPSSPTFLAGLSLLALANENNDLPSLVSYINQKFQLNISVDGDVLNATTISVTRDKCGIVISPQQSTTHSALNLGLLSSSPPKNICPQPTNPPTSSPPENETVKQNVSSESIFQSADAASGQIPLPNEWLCTVDNVSLVSPRLKVDFCLCSDRLVFNAKDKRYHVPFSSIHRAFLLPDPNGEELTLALILHTEKPLLIAKAKHSIVLLRMDKLAALSLTFNTAPSHPFIASARAALETSLQPFLDKEKSSVGAPVVSEDAKVADAIDVMLNTLFDHAAGAEKSTFPDSEAAGECTATVKKPSFSTFRSSGGNPFVHCYYKASDGPLFPLRDGILFLGKPLIWIPAKDVNSVNSENRGGRSFDLRVEVANPTGKKPITHEFGLIASEEQPNLTNYCNFLASRRGDDVEDKKPRTAPLPPVAPAREGVRRSTRDAVVKSSAGILRMVDENDYGASESEEYMSDSGSESGSESEDEDEEVDDDDDKPYNYDDNADNSVVALDSESDSESDEGGFASEDGLDGLSEEEPMPKRRRLEAQSSSGSSVEHISSSVVISVGTVEEEQKAAPASVSAAPAAPAPVRRARPGSAL